MITKERPLGIGGSDCAKILGQSKFGTPLDVYIEKKEKPFHAPNFRMKLGTQLEPLIQEKYKELTGYPCTFNNPTIFHSGYPFLFAHVDGIANNERIIECKATYNSTEWGEEGTNQVPVDYLCQVMHYMLITGLKVADIIVFMIDKEQFKMFHVEHDPDLINLILKKECQFWQNFINEIPPAPTSLEDIKNYYKISNPTKIEAPSEVYHLYNDLKNIRQQMRALKPEEERLKHSIMSFMKENEMLVTDEKTLCTWKSQHVKRFDLARFKEEYPQLYNDFCHSTDERRFLIK